MYGDAQVHVYAGLITSFAVSVPNVSISILEVHMKTKRVFYSELAYAVGIVTLALGTAFMERADFGMSMIVAPAYLLHLKISQILPAFSFGMAEYSLQAALIVLLSVCLRRFKPEYLFSFVTAVIYGMTLDAMIALVAMIPAGGVAGRLAFYLGGMAVCAFGVSMLFHTYIPPEAYELFVKEISAQTGKDIHAVKTAYDCVSCFVGVVLSFAFFGLGHFEGVKLGTIFCALINGSLIGVCSRAIESMFEFIDAFDLRKRLGA